jgi:adenosylhomocysteine nucleosidase
VRAECAVWRPPGVLGMAGQPQDKPWSSAATTLVLFAVKEEANAFRERVAIRPDLRILLTGIGKRHAEQSVVAALAAQRPRLVLSCGFAGGLRPELTTGTVLFCADPESGLEPALLAAGAKPARFHCSERVASRADDKRALWAATGADAVEMESQVICEACRKQNVPSAIVRVILDPAGEDLPLDFNQLMTPDQRLDRRKLALSLAKSPGKLPSLLRLQKQTQSAAARLAEVLVRCL